LLVKVEERRREAALCAEHLKSVVDGITKAFYDWIMNDSDMVPDLGSREAVTTERLRQLQFPDGLLPWNGRASEQSPASNDMMSQVADLGILQGFDRNPWGGGEWGLANLLYGTMNADSGLP
jgi:hypothetical protein